MIANILLSLGTILLVVLLFNLMIVVHELGHFLAARWRGLVVERFGVWFGKPLWEKKIGGVIYSLGSIPAGGFVALPQLAPMEVMEGKVETPREQLPPISALDKIIVAFAGPLFSFGLAVVFAVIVWQVGRPVGEAESTTVVGGVAPKSPAAAAGIQPGDRILSVDGHRVTRFGGMGSDSITWRVVRSEGETVAVEVDRAGQVQMLHPKPFVPEKTHWWNRKGLRMIGIGPATSAVVGEVEPGSSAAAAGFEEGDVITAVEGKKLMSPEDIYDAAHAADGKPFALTIDRGGRRVELNFEPRGVRVIRLQQPGTLARLLGGKGESPAARAGLMKGDLIVAVDGQPTTVVSRLTRYISGKGGMPVTLGIRRDGKEFDLSVTPRMAVIEATGEKRAMIGFTPGEGGGLGFMSMGRSRVVHPNPVEQIRASVMSIVSTLDALFSTKSSIGVQHMGGPVMMMNAYYQMLSGPEGLRLALWFSVVLNVNLALLNLLPIPVLDGGHITLAIVEGLRRKPVNVRVLETVQSTCALALIGLMIFIAFFDVQDLPFVGGGGGPGVKFEEASPGPDGAK